MAKRYTITRNSTIFKRMRLISLILLTQVFAPCPSVADEKTASALTELHGQVVDQHKIPVRRARLVCYRITTDDSGEEWVWGNWETTSDKNGRYTFSLPEKGTYKIATKEIGGTCTSATTKRFQSTMASPIRLEDLVVRPASASLTGRVTRADGTPASGLAYGYGSESFQCVETLAPPILARSGEFSIPNVLPDEPLSFWVIPKADTMQVWRNVALKEGEQEFVLSPDQFIEMPPGWAAESWWHRLAIQAPLRFPMETIAFTLPDLEGNMVSLTDKRFKDKAVVVSLWGSWCGGCLDEIPELVSLQAKYRDRGLEVIGIAFEEGTKDQRRKRVEKVIERFGINYTVLLAEGIMREKTIRSAISGIERFVGYPTTIFLGRDGKVIDHSSGFPAYNEQARAILVKEMEGKIANSLAAEPLAKSED